jgi:hypothetical protein
VLVDEVIVLLVHSLHHVVLRSSVWFTLVLEHGRFDVPGAVPGNHYHSVALVMLGYDLDMILVPLAGVPNFVDLSSFFKLEVHVLKRLFLFLFVVKEVHQIY